MRNKQWLASNVMSEMEEAVMIWYGTSAYLGT